MASRGGNVEYYAAHGPATGFAAHCRVLPLIRQAIGERAAGSAIQTLTPGRYGEVNGRDRRLVGADERHLRVQEVATSGPGHSYSTIPDGQLDMPIGLLGEMTIHATRAHHDPRHRGTAGDRARCDRGAGRCDVEHAPARLLPRQRRRPVNSAAGQLLSRHAHRAEHTGERGTRGIRQHCKAPIYAKTECKRRAEGTVFRPHFLPILAAVCRARVVAARVPLTAGSSKSGR